MLHTFFLGHLFIPPTYIHPIQYPHSPPDEYDWLPSSIRDVRYVSPNAVATINTGTSLSSLSPVFTFYLGFSIFVCERKLTQKDEKCKILRGGIPKQNRVHAQCVWIWRPWIETHFSVQVSLILFLSSLTSIQNVRCQVSMKTDLYGWGGDGVCYNYI